MRTAADIYGGGVEVDIQIEEGSLITRITVVGGLLLGAYITRRSPTTKDSRIPRSIESHHYARFLRRYVCVGIERVATRILDGIGRFEKGRQSHDASDLGQVRPTSTALRYSRTAALIRTVHGGI